MAVVSHVDDVVLADPAAEGCCALEGVGAIPAHTARRLDEESLAYGGEEMDIAYVIDVLVN